MKLAIHVLMISATALTACAGGGGFHTTEVVTSADGRTVCFDRLGGREAAADIHCVDEVTVEVADGLEPGICVKLTRLPESAEIVSVVRVSQDDCAGSDTAVASTTEASGPRDD